MPTRTQSIAEPIFYPVTPDRLPDLIQFSERHGKFRWCSCMRWRLPSTEFSRSERADREHALQTFVREETPVGILGYVADEPVGWCSIAPRETYAALERSRTLPRLDDAPTWSVVCFFVDRHMRRQGFTLTLLRAAVEYARSQGARIIEGYPHPGGPSYAYMGSHTTFRKAGFRDVTPKGQTRPIVRYVVGGNDRMPPVVSLSIAVQCHGPLAGLPGDRASRRIV